MKKILLTLFALLVVLALVACGTNDETTPAAGTTASPEATTEAAVTTVAAVTTPAVETTIPSLPTPTTTAAPVTTEEGIDIIYNVDPDYNGVNPNYDGQYNAFTFEDFHVDLDYNVALVFRIEETPISLYEELFFTTSDTDNGQWVVNENYSWTVTIDNETIEIDRISLANYRTNGWIRLDLGSEFSFDNYSYNEDNIHEFDVRIDVYGSDGKRAFYAYLTDPDYNGPYPHVKPIPLKIVPDTDVPPELVYLPSSDITPISGPTPGSGEDYKNAFDNSVRTKLCTGDNGDDYAVIARFNTEKSIFGFSLVNANDNESYNGRTIVAFSIYVSSDGENWGDPIFVADGNDEAGNPIDRAPISDNYLERFYLLDEAVSANYVKFVANNNDTYQVSEILFYVEK